MICASAGNHAQGLGYAARDLDIRARIVTLRTTPAIKVEAVAALGAEFELHGDDYRAAEAHCAQLVSSTGLTYIHPFDEPLVIADQCTIGDEIVRQSPGQLDAVFVPVGGGGLIAGIGSYMKALMPEVRIVRVEPYESDAMYRSLVAGRWIRLDRVCIFADGVAVRDTRTVADPAGALVVAGFRAAVTRDGISGQRLVAIVSGANMNFDRLRFVSEWAEFGEAREALFGVEIPERPEAFRPRAAMRRWTLRGRDGEAPCPTLGRRTPAESAGGIRVSLRVSRASGRAHVVS